MTGTAVCNRSVELLAPAGGMQQLTAALRFGADAVYVGIDKYGLRARASNFDDARLADAVALTHRQGRRLYAALNAYLWDDELTAFADSARQLARLGVDAAIVSDPGAVALLREIVPELPLHLSTQANTTNARAASFWHSQGVSRIILSRELSMERIRVIRKNTPPTLQLEAFVHGAMCAAISGRCLLSASLTARSANRGECAQPCRWLWKPARGKADNINDINDSIEIEPTERGAYILSAPDLCMIEHLPELIEAGVSTLKIEGRMKNEYSVAALVHAYRTALDHPERAAEAARSLRNISQRVTNTGFYYGAPTPSTGAGSPTQQMEYAARVESVDGGIAEVTIKNKFYVGDNLDALTPNGCISFTVEWIETECVRAECAVVPERIARLPIPAGVEAGDILRCVNRNHINKIL
ncbi:MAG: U32 family peptidase [Oscillospiraceae bacterium]|jgi:putative protease|nr:U32 family peptidase [Oscillospiraceae bacterium]